MRNLDSRVSMGLVVWSALAGLMSHLGARPVEARGPQAVVNAFCREDAFGARTSPATLSRIDPLVAWPLEPAWDHVVLITGYEVGGATVADGGVAEVEVSYVVVGRLAATRRDVEPQRARRRFQLIAGDDGWRIAGPPPPPHVFVHRVDGDATRYALGGRGGYLSQSHFVAEMMHAAGWQVPYESVADVVVGQTYASVADPTAGDIVVYFDGDVPYHVGLLAGPGEVVSAALGFGLVRGSIATFPGTVRYWRLRASPQAGFTAGRFAEDEARRLRQQPAGTQPE